MGVRTTRGIRCEKCGDFLSFARRRRLRSGLVCKCRHTAIAGFKKPARMHRDSHHREAIERLFRTFGPPVEVRIERLAERARGILRLLKEKPKSKEHRADTSRAAVAALETCCTLDQPPPKDLINLIEFLLGHGKGPRTGVRNFAKRLQVAKYVAQNPGASDRKIERDCNVSARTVATWKRQEDFIQLISRQFPT